MSRARTSRSEEHTSELQSPDHLVCRLLLEKKKHTSAEPIYDKTHNPSAKNLAHHICVVGLSVMSSRKISSPASSVSSRFSIFFFFNDTATTEIYTLSLHDALPISPSRRRVSAGRSVAPRTGP